MASPRQLAHSLLARLIARITILALVAALLPADTRASVPASPASVDSYALPDLTPEAPASLRKVLVCVVVVVVDPSGLTETAFGELYGRTGTDPIPYAFAGEPLDPNSGFQYHRARWMDPRVGRFTAMDRWRGNAFEPSSLHRFTYASNNPANALDPSGLITAPFGYAVEAALEPIYQSQHPKDDVLYGQPTGRGLVPELKPDIFNITKGVYLEIKPFSLSGIGKGVFQMAAYEYSYGLFGYRPEAEWLPPRTLMVGPVPIALVNIDGLILYTDVGDLAEDLLLLKTIAEARALLRAAKALTSAINEFARIGRLAPVAATGGQSRIDSAMGNAIMLSFFAGFAF